MGLKQFSYIIILLTLLILYSIGLIWYEQHDYVSYYATVRIVLSFYSILLLFCKNEYIGIGQNILIFFHTCSFIYGMIIFFIITGMNIFEILINGNLVNQPFLIMIMCIELIIIYFGYIVFFFTIIFQNDDTIDNTKKMILPK